MRAVPPSIPGPRGKAMNPIMSVIRKLTVNRQIVGNAKKELEAAERVYGEIPCEATADDLKVASDCHEFLNHETHSEGQFIEDAEPLRHAEGD